MSFSSAIFVKIFAVFFNIKSLLLKTSITFEIISIPFEFLIVFFPFSFLHKFSSTFKPQITTFPFWSNFEQF